jgi:hypothetical protein
MTTQPKHLDPNGLLRRSVRKQDLYTVEDNDMYRGAGGIGTDMGAIAVGSVIPINGGATAFPVYGDQSLLFTGDNWANGGVGTVTIVFTIVGYDQDGNLITEDATLATVVATPISSVTANVFAYVSSITVKSITLGGGATLDAAPLLAIGHGVSTAAGNTGRTRFPISAKVKSAGEILALIDPNGVAVAYTSDYTRHVLVNASGTTFVAGRYRVLYKQELGYGDHV